nr:hypothetical protein L203_01071 [Cryptococcus depauperatus CBS 7841]
MRARKRIGRKSVLLRRTLKLDTAMMRCPPEVIAIFIDMLAEQWTETLCPSRRWIDNVERYRRHASHSMPFADADADALFPVELAAEILRAAYISSNHPATKAILKDPND